MSKRIIETESIKCPLCSSEDYIAVASGIDFEYDTADNTFTFVRCTNCSVHFLNPRPRLLELGTIYPPNYEPYNFNEKNFTYRIRRFLETRKVRRFTAGLADKAKIMDAGCGGVSFLSTIRNNGKPNWELWGNDFDPDVCSQIEAEGFNAAVGRFEDLAFPDNTFDLIFLKQVIEHLEAPASVITKAACMLKSGGKLIVETPNTDAWDARIFRKRHWGGYHFPRHWTLFDKHTLTRMARENDLTVVTVEYLLSPAFWVYSAHHALKNRSFPSFIADFFNLRNPLPMSVACALDALQLFLTSKTSNIRIIFKKP